MALINHYLVFEIGNQISITPKRREYIEYFGRVPSNPIVRVTVEEQPVMIEENENALAPKAKAAKEILSD